MNRRKQITARTWLMTLLLLFVSAVVADDFDLDWYTIDGGGDMFSTGGEFELSGTIGQPDATTVVMTGGDFELTGGFWAPFAPGPAPVTPSAVEPGGPAEPKEPEPAP